MKLKDIEFCPICNKKGYILCTYTRYNNHYFELDSLNDDKTSFMTFRLNDILAKLSIYNTLSNYGNLFICFYLNRIVIEDYENELFFIMNIDENWDFDSFEKCIKSWINNLELFG